MEEEVAEAEVEAAGGEPAPVLVPPGTYVATKHPPSILSVP